MLKKETVMTIIEFGCGNAKTAGAIVIDINPRSQADIIHDLNVFPYPLTDDSADRIICRDVLEHVENFIKTMEEIWRIAKADCLIEISGPFMSSVNYFSDPTHKRAFTSRSFDYFVAGTEVHKHSYSYVTFELIFVSYDPDQLKTRHGISLWILKLINKNKIRYENKFAFIYPSSQIEFILKVIK